MPRKPPYIVFTQPLPTKGQYKVYSVATSESLGMIKGDNSKRYWEAFDNDGKFLQSAERKKQLMDFFREIDKKSRMGEGGGVGNRVLVVLDEGNGKVINDLFTQWNNIKTEADQEKWNEKVRNTTFGTYGNISINEVLDKFEFDKSTGINGILKKDFKNELNSALRYGKGGGVLSSNFDVIIDNKPLIQIFKDDFLETYNVFYYLKEEKIPNELQRILKGKKSLSPQEASIVYQELLKSNEIGKTFNVEVSEYGQGGGVDFDKTKSLIQSMTAKIFDDKYAGTGEDWDSKIFEKYWSYSEEEAINKLKKENKLPKDFELNRFRGKMAHGGGIGFEKLSDKVAKNYEGKKVAPKYQHEYGKTYSRAEAKEVGDKVAGKVYWQQQGRMAKGGGIEKKEEWYIKPKGKSSLDKYKSWGVSPLVVKIKNSKGEKGFFGFYKLMGFSEKAFGNLTYWLVPFAVNFRVIDEEKRIAKWDWIVKEEDVWMFNPMILKDSWIKADEINFDEWNFTKDQLEKYKIKNDAETDKAINEALLKYQNSFAEGGNIKKYEYSPSIEEQKTWDKKKTRIYDAYVNSYNTYKDLLEERKRAIGRNDKDEVKSIDLRLKNKLHVIKYAYSELTGTAFEEEFKDGGNLDSLDAKISKAIFQAYGNIDDAIEFKQYYTGHGVSPYRLVFLAVQKGFITPEEINKAVLNSAYETSSETEDAEEIGSSDMNHYVWSMLRDAGFDMKVENGRYIRVDKMATGGTILDEYEEEEFEKWKEDGNVSKNADGSYSTQDAGFRNRLKNLTELKKYFKKEFFSDSYYANGGSVEDYRAKAIERQRKEEEGKDFAPYRAFAYEDSYQFADFKTDDFHKAVKWAKETLEAQRVYRKNSENLWAIVDEFTPIEKRNNVIYAYSEVARFGEEDTKKMKFKKGGNTTFYHDQAKKTLGEHLYNHIASLNKEQLEKHLSHLQKEIERMKANDTEYTKQEFLPKYKQEEKFILYLLERLDEYKYADGGNVEEPQEYYRVFRNNAGKDVAVKILKNPIFGKYDYYVDGTLRGQFDTFAQARQEVNYENFDMYAKGGGVGKFKVGGYEVDFFHTKANVYANIEIPSENPTFEDDIQLKGVGKTEQEAFENLKKNFENKKYATGGNFDSEFYKDGGKVGGYTLEDFNPLLDEYDKVVSYKKIGKLEINQIVGKSQVEDKFLFKTEKDRDYWYEVLSKEQEKYFTVKNKRRYLEYILENNDPYLDRPSTVKKSEMLEYYADEIYYELRDNTSRNDFMQNLGFKKRFDKGGNFDSEFYKDGGSVGKQKYAYVQAETSTGEKVFKFFEEVPTHKEVYAYFRSVKDENGNPITLKDTTIHVEEVTDFDRDLFLEKCNEVAISTFGSPIKELDDMMFSFDKNNLSVFKFEAELENGTEVSIQTVDGVIVMEAEEEDEDKFKDGGSIDINFSTDTDYIKRENIKLVKYKNGKELYNWDYWDSYNVPAEKDELFSGLYVAKRPLPTKESEKQYSMFKKGGKLPKGAIYIKRSDIDSVIIYDEKLGEEVEIPANRIVNGIWFDNERTQMIIDRAKKEGLIPDKTKKTTTFIARFNGKKIELEAKSMFDAEQKAIKELKVPKSKRGLLSIMSKESYERGDFQFN
jgi:uncharacterized small protein (DUF1192 family)